MDTIFMNSKNSGTSDPHWLLLNFTDKTSLKRSDKYVESYENNKSKISAQTWNGRFKLPDGWYSVSDIQDYFQYILKTWRKDYT